MVFLFVVHCVECSPGILLVFHGTAVGFLFFFHGNSIGMFKGFFLFCRAMYTMHV